MVVVVNQNIFNQDNDRANGITNAIGGYRSGCGGIAATVAIDCFVGDQLQSDDKIRLPPQPFHDDKTKNNSSSSSVSPSSSSSSSSSSDEKFPAEPSSLTPMVTDAENIREQEDYPPPPYRFIDKQPQPQLPLQFQQSQPNRYDGYCGKQMMIAVAAAAAASNDVRDVEEQQPPAPASTPNITVPNSSTAYVMLDMVTAQKRLLDLQGRLEFVKPMVVVQPPSSSSSLSSALDAVGCGPAAAQPTDTNVEVTT
jgi:hypothetical protein